MNHAIELSHITKDYGNNRGVFDVSFTVKTGEVFGFLGPNGAGKPLPSASCWDLSVRKAGRH